jgi:tellurite resistance protein TehA-like permease
LAIPAVPTLLLGVNWIAYAALVTLTLIRLLKFPAEVLKDASDFKRAPGFFAIVAGTCVLGAQTMVVADGPAIATVLWYAGLGLWFLVMYSFFTAMTLSEDKPPLASGISGAWLMASVATQSIAVLRASLDTGQPPPPALQLLCLVMFMIGCMLYLAIIPLISYRLTFFRFETQDFTPPYWINMGAVAITTLAGSLLILHADKWPLIRNYTSFLRGFTLFFWAAATWWIPFLIILTGWRYLVRKDRLQYEPQFWAMVFPLGMYAVATFELSRAETLPFLEAMARFSGFAALTAWALTFAGLCRRLTRMRQS